MTSTPITAAPQKRSFFLPLSLVAVAVACAAIVLSILISEKLLLADHLKAGVVALVRTQSPALTIALLLPILQTIALGVIFILILRRFVRRAANMITKRVDTEKLALMELATHQLGAPLATFRWWLEILKDPDSKDMNPKEIYAEVEEAVNRLDMIIQALSNAETVDMKKLTSKLGTLLSLRHLILDIAHEMDNDLKMKDIRMDIDVEASMKPMRVDSDQVKGVLRELIGNAYAFSNPKKKITITVKTSKPKNAALVEVTDEGIGIPASEQKRIFEKFFRASNAPAVKPVGTGLGLFNAKGIVEGMGGEMWIKSKEKKGTSVFFTIPFEAAKGA